MHYFGLLVHESGQVTALFETQLLEVAVTKFFNNACRMAMRLLMFICD